MRIREKREKERERERFPRPVKETASNDIAKQPKGIHESAVTPQGLHYDAMHNATCARLPGASYIAMPDTNMISKRISPQCLFPPTIFLTFPPILFTTREAELNADRV